MRMVVVVDEDVDIYNADSVLWATMSRVDPGRDIIVESGKPIAGFPIERGGNPVALKVGGNVGFDATVPFAEKWRYAMGEFPEVDLSEFFTQEEIKKGKAQQSEYAKLQAGRRN